MVHKRQTKNKMLGLLLWLLPWSFWCNSEGYGRFFSVCSTHAFSIPHVKGRVFGGTMDKGATTRLFQSSNSNSGDVTRGAALLFENVDVYRGPAQILSQISWRVEPKTKWALVGANGSGKSTLLKAIVDQIPYDGRIAIGAKSNKIGYLQQTAVAGSNRTIYEEAASGMEAINAAAKAMEEAAETGDLDALDKATTRFEALGGYQQEVKVASVLKGLGFTDFNKRCHELSGGWQMRVSFAKVLLSEPTLCLLDEPRYVEKIIHIQYCEPSLTAWSQLDFSVLCMVVTTWIKQPKNGWLAIWQRMKEKEPWSLSRMTQNFSCLWITLLKSWQAQEAYRSINPATTSSISN